MKNETEKGKTPGEASEILNVTTATLRNYVKNFSQFLSPGANQKTRKRFSPEDMDILKQATELLGEGYTYESTLDILDETFPEPPLSGDVIDESTPEPEPTVEEPFTGMALLDWFEETLKRQNELHQTALQAQNEHIEELQKQNERERQENEQLKRQLNYERLPWFRKWFTEPPK